jgi:DNA-binding XRE family transcriptional regulator
MTATARYKIIDINEELAKRLKTPKHRAEYEAGLMMLRFGVTVCMRREELGYKQKDMKQFGIPAETMCRIEKGARLPDPATQTKLARALQAEIVVGPTGEWKLRPIADLQKAA